ncbi:hypothetical protein BJX68DRAFT_265261 [Aspergillus pseudodeflectus]|uniref:Uncharacterized protein n=1 Tax=Aspergillus pseudodeflectus TaxID=176178 RepID=A0ABR4KLW2_9EURO
MPMRWTPEKDQLLLLKILETHQLAVDTKRIAEAWPAGEDKPTPRAITERLVRMRAMVKSTASASGSPGGEKTGGHFSIGKGVGRGSPASTPRASHANPRAKAQSVSAPASPFSTPPSAKRKRVETKVESDGEEEGDPMKTKMDVDQDADGEYELDEEFTPPINKEGKKKVARVLFPNAMKAASAAGSGSVPAGGVGGDGTTATTDFAVEVRAGSTLDLAASPVKRESRARRPSAMRYGMVNYEDTLDDEDMAGGGDDDMESSASSYVPDQAFDMDEDFA